MAACGAPDEKGSNQENKHGLYRPAWYKIKVLT
jgi:hypothetical protein